ncbi:hypothetical protein ACK3TF_003070 [Chlorella vulgaris]
MEHPSRVTFERIQADPTLPERDASVLAEFEAAPWLLPPRTKALKYTGVHQLDTLAELRSTPFGNVTKTITLLIFSAKYAAMTQNGVYSMVKFGGVRNYIVATWDPDDLQACADLNLPCADVTSFLPETMDKGPDAGAFGTHDFLVIAWHRPAVLAHLLKLGYAVLTTDSDIVYLLKPVWASYMAYLEQGEADAAFQSEGPVNTGNFVMLPTTASVAFATAWAALAPKMFKERLTDQTGLPHVDPALWMVCSDRSACQRDRAGIIHRNASGTQMLIRRFYPNQFNYWSDVCSLSRTEGFPKIDPCDWAGMNKCGLRPLASAMHQHVHLICLPAVMFLHPICANYEMKVRAFKHQEFWFVDDESESIVAHGSYVFRTAGVKVLTFALCYAACTQNNTMSHVTVCHPLQWRVNTTEVMLYSCPEYGMALFHERRVYNKTLQATTS